LRTRLRVRPTSRGWQALVIGLIVFAGARLIGTTQIHQLAYALLALLVAALVLGYFAARGLDFSRSLPVSRFFARRSSRIDLLISNSSKLNSSHIKVLDRLPEPRGFESPPLSKGGGAAVEVPVTFPRRGLYSLGPADVQAVEPFGLLRFSRSFLDGDEVVVYPEVHEITNLPIQGGAVESGSRGARGQSGDDFAGLREYRRGDDMRHIHWKSLARTGELHVREFTLQAPLRYTVVLDLRRRGLKVPEAEIEDAVSATASVLAHLKEAGLPSRLICTDGESEATEFAADEAAYWKAMRVLATVKDSGDTELGVFLSEERGNLGEGLILVSRGIGGSEDLSATVRRFRGGGRPVTVISVASHTYMGYPPGSQALADKAAAFSASVDGLESEGASVITVQQPEGAASLAYERSAV